MDFIRKAAAWLHRRAENVLAAMLGVMFAAFMVQIVFRYFFNLPTGWTTELTLIIWLWGVLWGAAFVVKESEEIRFDLVSSMVGARTRLIMAAVSGVSIVVLYLDLAAGDLVLRHLHEGGEIVVSEDTDELALLDLSRVRRRGDRSLSVAVVGSAPRKSA